MAITPQQLRALRMRAQCLSPRHAASDLVAVVHAACGMNAQFGPAMRLALRARIRGLTNARIDAAIANERSLVRTWAMRGTLHLLPAKDVRWIVALLGPDLLASGKRRRQQLGLDEATTARGLRLLRSIMRGQAPLHRGELVERLAKRGFMLERKSQAPIHLIGASALNGDLCLGPDEATGEPTYVLPDEWIAQEPTLAQAKAPRELAQRYLTGYGPAGAQDFAAWAGLTLANARSGWPPDDALVSLACDGKTLAMLKTSAPRLRPSPGRKPVVNLLPAFDTYLLGYADRSQVVPPEHHVDVYHGGQVVPVVLVDGIAAGVWRYERKGKRLEIMVRAFARFDETVKQLVLKEAEDIGRFLERPMTVRWMCGRGVWNTKSTKGRGRDPQEHTGILRTSFM